jgi:hypothetical protein
VGSSASSVNVNTQLRRSKLYVKTLPFVECGDGRTYASAARRPGAFETGFDETVGVAFMGGTLRLPSKFGLSGAWIEAERLSENDGEFRFKETVEVFVEGEN